MGWRPIFLINLPIGLLALAGASALLREPPVRRAPPRLHPVGALLVSAGLLALLYPLVQGHDRRARRRRVDVTHPVRHVEIRLNVRDGYDRSWGGSQIAGGKAAEHDHDDPGGAGDDPADGAAPKTPPRHGSPAWA